MYFYIIYIFAKNKVIIIGKIIFAPSDSLKSGLFLEFLIVCQSQKRSKQLLY